MKHELSLKSKIIYVSCINKEAHRWRKNVSGTTCENDVFYGLAISSKLFNKATKNLIGENTQTLKMHYAYQYSEMTLYYKGCLRSFNDKIGI